MSHPDELLLPYISGELSQADSDQVAAHLAECAECTRAVADLREMDQRLRRLRPLEPVLSRARPTVAPRRLSTTMIRAAAAVLLLATGAGGMWWWQRPSAPPPQTSGLFALVFYEPVAVRAAQTDEQRRDRYRRFGQWQRPFAARTVDGVKLLDESGRFFTSPTQVRVADRTALPDLALSGIVVVRGDSYEEIAALVPGCPVFEDGGHVEVRRIR